MSAVCPPKTCSASEGVGRGAGSKILDRGHLAQVIVRPECRHSAQNAASDVVAFRQLGNRSGVLNLVGSPAVIVIVSLAHAENLATDPSDLVIRRPRMPPTQVSDLRQTRAPIGDVLLVRTP